MPTKVIIVHDKMQKNYTYTLSEPMGKNFDSMFNPELTPKEMLELGVFGGHYMTDCRDEFPKEWYTHAKLNTEKHDTSLNYFKKDASQSLKVWKQKGWINEEHDVRGWFQWYCRYYMGRRIPEEDIRQIKRWKAIRRHAVQVHNNCKKGDILCRSKQRQALLHWAYDSRRL